MSLGLAPFTGRTVLPVAPAYFGSTSNPADAGSLTGVTQVTITPPASMVTGDLVIVTCMCRTLSLTWTVNNTGGQTWTTASAGFGASAKTMAVFWCQFNGTWSANPIFECLTNATNISGIMHVSRPDVSSRVWAVDVAFAQANFGIPTGPPYPVTRPGLTTVNSRTVALAGWFVSAGNTWANLAGTGWVVTGTAQYRNGTQSLTFAHGLNGPGGAVLPTVSKEESTAATCQTCIMSWSAS